MTDAQVTIPSQWAAHTCTNHHAAHTATRKERCVTVGVSGEHVETNEPQRAALVPESGLAFEL